MLISIDTHLEVLRKRVKQLPPLDPQQPAHRTLSIIGDVLEESLFRRTPEAVAIIRRTLDTGRALLQEITAFLEAGRADQSCQMENAGDFDGLILQVNEMAGALHRSAQALVALRTDKGKDGERLSSLLLRTASWEMDFHDARQAAISGMTANAETATEAGLTAQQLERFLRRARSNDDLRVVKMYPISGGMGKTTWVAEIEESSGLQELVIRQELPKQLNSGCAFAIPDEFALLQILHAAGVPVPEPLHLCSDPTLAATPYHVTPRVAGTAPGDFFGMREGLEPTAVLDLAGALGRLHAQPVSLFGAYLQARGRESVLKDSIRAHYLNIIAEWRRAVEGYRIDRSPSIIFVLDWLETHVPDDHRPLVLTHGDANLHNIMVADGRMTSLLDWELADFGGPEQDLAYIRSNIEKQIPWDDFIACYHEHGGPDLVEEYFPFHLVFQLMRLYVGALNGQAMLARNEHDDERLIEIDLNYVPLELKMILDIVRENSSADARPRQAATV